METYKRVFVIVLDSLGIGAMPDSEKFGDKGVDTFGHILDKMGTLDIPNLQKLGMLNLHKGGTMEGVENPIGRYMRIGETSNGKDTMTGHWEMMGIYTQKPFITFTETGFYRIILKGRSSCPDFGRLCCDYQDASVIFLSPEYSLSCLTSEDLSFYKKSIFLSFHADLINASAIF